MSRRTLSLIILLLLTVPTLVWGADVQSDYDRDVDLSRLAKFRFADQAIRPPQDALADNDLADKRIRNAIRLHFTDLGLEEARDGEKADVVIAYYATIAHKKRIITRGYTRPLWWRAPDAAWTEDYADGTALIDLVDPTTAQLIWRARITGGITLDNAEERTRDAIRRLASEFRRDRERQEKRR